MNRFLLNALLIFSFLSSAVFAQVSLTTASDSDLKKISKERTLELQSAVVLTNDLSSANAKRIQIAFASAFEFVDTVVQRKDISNETKLELIAPVTDSIAASYGEAAEPFTDINLASGSGTTGEKMINAVKHFFLFWGKQADFVFASWFRKNSETPLESMRRAKIGKEVFRSLSDSTDALLKANDGASQPTLNEFQKKVVNRYAEIVNAGLKSEPYRYRNFTRGVMLTVATIAGFYAVLPRGFQEHILFMPPLDFFPPFTFMDRTLLSPLVARGLWTVYGLVGYLIPRTSTGFSLGAMIAKTRDKFRKIREQYGTGVTDCEMGLVGNTMSTRRSSR